MHGGGISSVRRAVPHSVCRVGNEKRRYAEALNALDLLFAAIPKMGEWHLPLGSVRHPIPMHQRQLLIQRELLQYQFGAFFWRKFRVHPRTVRVLSSDNTRSEHACDACKK